MYVPFRVYATYIKSNRVKPEQPQWFYYEGCSSKEDQRFRTYRAFSGSIKASSLIVIDNEFNDKEAVEIINDSIQTNNLSRH